MKLHVKSFVIAKHRAYIFLIFVISELIGFLADILTMQTKFILRDSEFSRNFKENTVCTLESQIYKIARKCLEWLSYVNNSVSVTWLGYKG